MTAVVRCAGVISWSDIVFILKDEFSQYVRDISDESGCERSENEKEENVEVEEVLAETVVNPEKSKPKPWEWSSLFGTIPFSRESGINPFVSW